MGLVARGLGLVELLKAGTVLQVRRFSSDKNCRLRVNSNTHSSTTSADVSLFATKFQYFEFAILHTISPIATNCAFDY